VREKTPKERCSIARLILLPGLITLAVTFLRLVGEMRHWSKTWFNPAPGGMGSIVGITWLAPIFGIYFALKLVKQGQGPRSPWRAVAIAALGALFALGMALQGYKIIGGDPFLVTAVFLWLPFALAAVLQFAGWPALCKTLLAYAYSARVPVAILMFLALRAHWGTHYDAIPPTTTPVGFAWIYLWLALLPQLVFWVGFTVLAGSLFGSLAAAVRRARQAGTDEKA